MAYTATIEWVYKPFLPVYGRFQLFFYTHIIACLGICVNTLIQIFSSSLVNKLQKQQIEDFLHHKIPFIWPIRLYNNTSFDARIEHCTWN